MARNTNCLENIQCPSCGCESRFNIVARVTAEVSDDGAEFRGDAEWDDDSAITCPQCDRTGKVGEFRWKTYNVLVYREMLLRFDGIRAPSQDAAASFADSMPTCAASDVEDCDGESVSALVDLAGDAEFAGSRTIDLEPGGKLRIHEHLLDTLLNVKRLAEKSGDEETDPFALLDLIADEARAAIKYANKE
jgi:hypothetical protein